MRPHTLIIIQIFAILCFTVPPHLARANDPIEIPLVITKLPLDQWNKNRIVPTRTGNGLQLKDKGNTPFNDASFWQISFNKDLPYGRKVFSFLVDVNPAHRPLWGTSLLQPILNGKEAIPALNIEGKPAFQKIIAEDGKGFIEAQSQSIKLALPKTEKTLGTFSFMTAGAENYDVVLKDFKVTVWPETDDRVWPQRPLASHIPFNNFEKKNLLIEWHDDEESLKIQNTEITIIGPSTSQTMKVALPLNPSAASASRVSNIDLSSLSEPGEYQIVVPSFGSRTQENIAHFQISSDKTYTKLRDEAWGAFYWITNTDKGPFPKAHLQDKTAKLFEDQTVTRNISGGWFDAGDYGKYSVNGAYSLALILLTGLHAEEALSHPIDPIANRKSKLPDWLSVADDQLKWLLKMQAPNGGVNHKATTKIWPNLDTSPEDDKATKWIMPVTSTATADFAAVMSLAAKTYQRFGAEDRASVFHDAAKKAMIWLNKNPDLVMIDQQLSGSVYGGPYDDTDDTDERFFAESAYAALTGNTAEIAKVEAKLEKRRAVLNRSKNDTYWGKVDLLGFWALRTIHDDLSKGARSTVDGALRSAAHKWRIEKARSSWRIPVSDDGQLPWGSNSIIATVGWHWLLWGHVSGEDKYVGEARDQLHWFFGRNPLNQTYVTGKGKHDAKDPHFRPYVSGAIKLPNGFLVGGPNSIDLAGDPAASGLTGQPPMRMYVDNKESYATNEVAINWQAAYATYLSLLDFVDK